MARHEAGELQDEEEGQGGGEDPGPIARRQFPGEGLGALPLRTQLLDVRAQARGALRSEDGLQPLDHLPSVPGTGLARKPFEEAAQGAVGVVGPVTGGSDDRAAELPKLA